MQVADAKQFTGRGIIKANPRSRSASQFGAQKGDRASKRLTRRPATHNRPLIHAHGFNATADWPRMDCVHLRGLNVDNLRTRQRSRIRTGQGHGLDAARIRLRSRTGHGLTVAADIGAAICPDRLRFLRVHCADAKTSF